MKKVYLILLLIIVIPISIWCSPASFVWDWGHQFNDGYEVGYNDIQDTLQEVLDCNLEYPFFYYNYTEGICDWWDNPFWYQQGYEEGIKKGARDYVKEKGGTGYDKETMYNRRNNSIFGK